MKFSPMLFSAAMGLTVLSAPAFAEDMARPAPRCFSMQEFQGWKAPDARTIYIRVGVNDYYRLDMSTRCSMLKSVDSHLVTKFQGSESVCAPIDWDITVVNSAGMRQGCIVKAMTPLTPEEATAIPAKFKP